MSTSPTFAERLYEQLAPFAAMDELGHTWALCDGIGAMFQPQEDLAADRPDGLSGYASLLDIDSMDPNDDDLDDKLAYLGQFIGESVQLGLSNQQKIDWIRDIHQWKRGRPATTLAAIAPYLVPGARITVRERDGSAWRYTLITRTADTLNSTAIAQRIQEQKPGPDIAQYFVRDTADYEWLATPADSGMTTYDDLKTSGTYLTYGDLANAHT